MVIEVINLFNLWFGLFAGIASIVLTHFDNKYANSWALISLTNLFLSVVQSPFK